MQHKNALERRLVRMSKILIEEEKKGQEIGASVVFNASQSVGLRVGWSVLIVASTAILIGQCYDRLDYYFQYPVEVDVQTQPMKTVIFPTFNFCTEDTPDVHSILADFQKSMLSCTFVMLAMFMQVEGVNLSTLWKAADASKMVKFVNVTNGFMVPQAEEMWSPYGTCVKYYTGEELPNKGQDTAFEIGIIKPESKNCQLAVLRLAFHPAGDQMDYRSSAVLTPGYRRKIGLGIRKYLFANRPKNPCIKDRAVYNRCMDRCRYEMYTHLKCRYPFLPSDLPIPTCNTSKAMVNDFFKSFEIYMGFTTNPKKCGCVETCDQVFYDSVVSPEEITDNITYFTYYFRDNFFTIVSERLTYDIISLLSDTGGNMGLCLGWSVLIFWVQHIKDLKRKKIKPMFQENDPLFKIVRRTYLQQVDSQKQKRAKPFKCSSCASLCVTIICMIFASYIVVGRVMYYFSFPTKTELKIINDDTVHYPTITICWETKLISNRFTLLARKTKANKCNLSLSDLLTSFNPMKIWQLASVSDEMGDTFEKISSQYRRSDALPYGNCTTIITGPTSNADTYYDFMIRHRATGKATCSKYVKIMVTLPGEIIDPTRFYLIPERTLASFEFTLQVIHKEDLIANPHSVEEIAACKAKCITDRMMKKLTCRMPYVPDVGHLRFCNNSHEAKITEAVYIEAFVSTRPQEDCGCPPPAKYIIYYTKVNIDNKDMGLSLMVFFFGNTRVEHFSQVSSYDVSKLFSEVGGNASAILGLSFISIFEFIYSACSALASKFRQKSVSK